MRFSLVLFGSTCVSRDPQPQPSCDIQPHTSNCPHPTAHVSNSLSSHSDRPFSFKILYFLWIYNLFQPPTFHLPHLFIPSLLSLLKLIIFLISFISLHLIFFLSLSLSLFQSQSMNYHGHFSSLSPLFLSSVHVLSLDTVTLPVHVHHSRPPIYISHHSGPPPSSFTNGISL